MTTLRIQSLAHTGMTRAAIPAKKAQRTVVAVISGKWVIRMYRVHRSRRELAQLSAHLLADIGLTEAQRQAELSKPFWKFQGPG